MPENPEKRCRALIDYLQERALLKDRRLIWAFQEVPLREFIPENLCDEERLYNDEPLPFYQKGWYVRTISAPHMICIMLQALGLEAGDNLLILGAKSGYIAALATYMTMEGEIFIVEANEEIASATKDNLKKTGFDETISVVHGSPLDGLPKLGPWQRILVTGAITEETLGKLLWQLDEKKGVLFAPVGGEDFQEFLQVLRDGKEYYGRSLGSVRFGPLQLEITYKGESPAQSAVMKKLEEEHRRFFAVKVPEIRIIPDKNRVDQSVGEIVGKYEASPGKPDEKEMAPEELEEIAVQEASKARGAVRLLYLCELLDLDFNYVVKVLGESPRGKLQETGPNPLQDRVFRVPVADPDMLQKVRLHCENLIGNMRALQAENNVAEKLAIMQEANEVVEKLEDLADQTGIKIKKLKATVLRLFATEKVLQDLETVAKPSKDVLDKKADLVQQEVQQASEVSDILKGEIKRILALLK